MLYSRDPHFVSSGHVIPISSHLLLLTKLLTTIYSVYLIKLLLILQYYNVRPTYGSTYS